MCAGPCGRASSGPRRDRRSPRRDSAQGRWSRSIPRVWHGGRNNCLRASAASLRPVINATGILLHTGLGRAPLAEEAIAAVAEVARGYCNLELDLEEGTRAAAPRDRAAALRADRGRGRDGRQQQRRRHRAGLAGAGGRARGDRLARAARRDRRQLPAPGDLRGLGGHPPRGRHDQQDPACRTTSAPSARRRPRSCGSIAATSGSSASPRTPGSPSSSQLAHDRELCG